MKVHEDNSGNKLLIYPNGDIKLQLSNEGGIKRNIGTITPKGVLVKIEISIFIKFNAFGFCYESIKLANPNQIDVYYNGEEEERGWYSISREQFEAHKKFLNFKKQGFELRCYVPVKYWEYSKS